MGLSHSPDMAVRLGFSPYPGCMEDWYLDMLYPRGRRDAYSVRFDKLEGFKLSTGEHFVNVHSGDVRP